MLRYLVTTFRTPQFEPSVIEAHNAFLDRLRQQGKLELAGPFTDKSGGAYVIRATNPNEAKAQAFGTVPGIRMNLGRLAQARH